LLDGLDEVESGARKECINAINNYRQVHPLVHVVVCCRITDYLSLPTKLRLLNAVVIQPLTQEQIDTYLENIGDRKEALHEALQKDADLRELTTTPLMLTILMFAFRTMPLDKISALSSFEAKREQVFAAYVQHMLKRRGASNRYTPQQITHWLTYLARQMKRQSQTVFYIEQMQPDWLPKKWQRYLYRALTGALLGGLLGGLFLWPALYLFGRLVPYLIPNFFNPYGYLSILVSVSVIGLVIGSLVGLVIGLSRRKTTAIRTADVITWSWANAFRAFIISMVSGSFGFLIAISLGNSTFIVFFLLIIVLFGGILSALASRFPRRKAHQHTHIVPYQGIWSAFGRGMLIGLITAGLTLTAYTLFLNSILSLFSPDTLFIYIYSVIIACISGVMIGIIFSISTSQLDTRNSIKPNQGIWRSAFNGGRVLLIIVFIVLFIIGMYLIALLHEYTINNQQNHTAFIFDQIIAGAILGLMIGTFFGLLNGGMACIKHMMLRLFLWRARAIPWNYVGFLDYAAERVFLCKVGGGYIFLHRLLLDYFASLEATPTS
jgi:eukaryotic-like serine/threonine-protein kinase